MSRVVGYSTNDIYVEINGDLHNNKTNNISTSTDQKRPSIDTTAQLQYSNDDRENHYNGRSSTNSTAKKKLLQASIICVRKTNINLIRLYISFFFGLGCFYDS